MEDKKMYRLFIENPDKGLEKIMNRYMAFVYTIVYGKLANICNKQDMEECVSHVFYELYRSRENIDLEKGSIKSYLAVLSKRKAIDVFRRCKKHADNVSIDESPHDWIPSDSNIEQEMIDNETSDILINAIQQLGEPDSQIIIRKYYFGQSAKVISQALGLKENTVNKKVSRALDKLKKALGGVM